MTDFRIERLAFTRADVDAWGTAGKHSNWPVVYTLNNRTDVYVGETGNATARIKQHLQSDSKHGLEHTQVLVDETFNKSACLDLESLLIRWFAGDGKFKVRNGNAGIIDADYFNRANYRNRFDRIFEDLRNAGYFSRSVPEIENTDLFKLSPFKSLNEDQQAAVEDIVDSLLVDLQTQTGSTIVVEGGPGTGKTILATYLIKLLVDIQGTTEEDEIPEDSRFSDFFVSGNRELLQGLRIGLVIPQQSLRTSVQRVFRRISGLERIEVLTPFTVGDAEKSFDLLIVDEAHRLNRLAPQAHPTLNNRFAEINNKLYGADGRTNNQLDWITTRSRHQILLLDPLQSVATADLPAPLLRELTTRARDTQRLHTLRSQMRINSEEDYVGHIRDVLAVRDPAPKTFHGYDLRIFDDFDEMYAAIAAKERQFGLSRLVAGYAWPWVSKKHPDTPDIHLGTHEMFWNRTDKDWINSPTSAEEVGSIHTVQGYDLNYAGVIFGPELSFDQDHRRFVFNRSSYYDSRAMRNNGKLGMTFSDDDILQYVLNVYGVLLTRGMRGTFIYAVDPGVRQHLGTWLSPIISSSSRRASLSSREGAIEGDGAAR